MDQEARYSIPVCVQRKLSSASKGKVQSSVNLKLMDRGCELACYPPATRDVRARVENNNSNYTFHFRFTVSCNL